MGLPNTLLNGIDELDFGVRKGAGTSTFCGFRGGGNSTGRGLAVPV